MAPDELRVLTLPPELVRRVVYMPRLPLTVPVPVVRYMPPPVAALRGV